MLDNQIDFQTGPFTISYLEKMKTKKTHKQARGEGNRES